MLSSYLCLRSKKQNHLINYAFAVLNERAIFAYAFILAFLFISLLMHYGEIGLIIMKLKYEEILLGFLEN